MRDIRFRAWFNSKPTWCNQMFYSDEEDFLGDWFNECESAKTSANLPISCVFMQFTGLKDTKTKEDVYAEDICNITYDVSLPDAEKVDYRKTTATIHYDDERLRWFWSVCDCYKTVIDCDEYEITTIEVIGNIHENPELIEEKK